MATTDCLLNCLHEVRLERFHRNFVERGLVNCEQLSTLLVDDYSRFGVVSADDRRRLFQLIHIIKSVQADGVFCEHGRNMPAAPVRQSRVIPSRHSIDQVKSESVGNGQMPPQKATVTETNVVEKCPPAPVRAFIKPITSDSNYRVQYEPSSTAENHRLHVTEEPKVRSNPKAVEKDVGTPVFHCRKVLNFSDTELCSDNDDCGHFTTKSRNSGTETASNGNMSNSNVRKNKNLRPPDLALTDFVSSPQAFVLSADTKTGRRSHRSTGASQNLHSDLHFSVNERHRPVSSFARTAHPRNRLSSENEEFQNHAYFPSFDSQTAEENSALPVEPIYHTAGYNYGVPGSQLSQVIARTVDKDTNGEQVCVDKIRVCVRKRPRTAREIKRNEPDVVKIRARKTVVVEELKIAVDLTKYIQQHVMAFDIAFDENCRNIDIYEQAVKPLVNGIFSKRSGVCFAFGQTGAGKTYTLLGTKSEPGLYQLAGTDIFSLAKTKAKNHNLLHVWASYYEIYCGHLFDLLNKRKRLHVRENGKQKVCIIGLMENEVTDIKSLVRVVGYGNSFRSRGSTGVNPHSSRSHALLQLEVRDSNDGKIGRLTFIDLAGSERAADAVHSDRQTRIEGAEINQSLLALKECIRSIDQEAGHTPYRQSKLTHILRESFLGHSQTVMIANITPTQTSCEDTLNTLRYADRVKELTKESAKKANSSPSSAGGTSAVPAHSQPDAVDDQPSPLMKGPVPSLFHPSNIQFSSTPNKAAAAKLRRLSAGDDINRVLFDASADEPITGHDLGRQSSLEENHFNRISPIEDCPKSAMLDKELLNRMAELGIAALPSSNNVHSETFSMEDVEEGKEVDAEMLCSCRSANSSFTSCRIPPHAPEKGNVLASVEVGSPKVASFRHSVAGTDAGVPHTLFAEAKACMENARANIRDFLESERSRSSVGSLPGGQLSAARKDGSSSTSGDNRPVLSSSSSDSSDANRRDTKNERVTEVEQVFKFSMEAGNDSDRLTSEFVVERLPVGGPGADHHRTDQQVQVMPHANGEEQFGEKSAVADRPTASKDSTTRSWAEIFEKSNEAGDHVARDDSRPDGDVSVDDIVTPDMLETLKAKIKELKRRQEQLERDQMFFTQGRPVPVSSVAGAADTAMVTSTSGVANRQDFHKDGIGQTDSPGGLVNAELSVPMDRMQSALPDATELYNKSHSISSSVSASSRISIREAVVSKPAVSADSAVFSMTTDRFHPGPAMASYVSSGQSQHLVETSGSVNISHVDGAKHLMDSNSNEKTNSSKVTELTVTSSTFIPSQSVLPTSSHFSLPSCSSSRPLYSVASAMPVSVSSAQMSDPSLAGIRSADLRPEGAVLESAPSQSRDASVRLSLLQKPVSLPVHSDSAFTMVGYSAVTATTGGLQVADANPSHSLPLTVSDRRSTVDHAVADVSAKASTVIKQQMFTPIEPFPVTPRGDVHSGNQLEVNCRAGRSLGTASGPVVDVGHTDGEVDLKLRSQNLLISSHEDQLTAVTQLCKQEMCLLMDVRSGAMNFDKYVSSVQQVLLTKLKIIEALNQHIDAFH